MAKSSIDLTLCDQSQPTYDALVTALRNLAAALPFRAFGGAAECPACLALHYPHRSERMHEARCPLGQARDLLAFLDAPGGGRS